MCMHGEATVGKASFPNKNSIIWVVLCLNSQACRSSLMHTSPSFTHAHITLPHSCTHHPPSLTHTSPSLTHTSPSLTHAHITLPHSLTHHLPSLMHTSPSQTHLHNDEEVFPGLSLCDNMISILKSARLKSVCNCQTFPLVQ